MIRIDENLVTTEEAEKLKAICAPFPQGETEIDLSDEYLKNILKRIDPYIEIYSKEIKLTKPLFYHKAIIVNQDDNNKMEPYPLHYDHTATDYFGSFCISPCVSLLYLSDINKDFEGGQLYFPFQKTLIEPKIGKLVTFPTGVMHSHKVLPFFGERRYLIKIFHLFKTGLMEEDANSLRKRIIINNPGTYN